MTEGEVVTIGVAGVGFLIQGVAYLVVRTRDLEQIKQSVDKKIDAETLERTRALNMAVQDRDEELEKLVREWQTNQRVQDNAVGEMGLSLRRFIESVEKEMHKIEIWGRDNYVQKPEMDAFRSDIKGIFSDLKAIMAEMKDDIKEDIRELKEKVH